MKILFIEYDCAFSKVIIRVFGNSNNSKPGSIWKIEWLSLIQVGLNCYWLDRTMISCNLLTWTSHLLDFVSIRWGCRLLLKMHCNLWLSQWDEIQSLNIIKFWLAHFNMDWEIQWSNQVLGVGFNIECTQKLQFNSTWLDSTWNLEKNILSTKCWNNLPFWWCFVDALSPWIIAWCIQWLSYNVDVYYSFLLHVCMANWLTTSVIMLKANIKHHKHHENIQHHTRTNCP